MYEFNVSVAMSAEAAEAALREALAAEKFGVVSEINVQAIMKAKLDKDIPAYKILGACNPGLASRVLEADPNAGVLLPCNVVVRAEGDGAVISFQDPMVMVTLTGSDAIEAVAVEAKAGLERVRERLQTA